MKKSLHTLLFLAIILLFAQCGVRNVYINAMQPAEITFPSYVNTMVLIDRSEFDKKQVNVVEGILTGELPGEDRAASQEALASLQRNLMSSPRFQVKLASERLIGNSVTSAFPQPLNWKNVEDLCKKYNAEVLVSLEMFDTDFIVTNGKKKVKKMVENNGTKKEVEVDEYFAQGVGDLTMGFRIYDPKAKTIADQQLFKKTNTWSATGTSIQDAVARLIMKSEASRNLAGIAGSSYAAKIAPMPITLYREFYSKAKHCPEVKMGRRMADVNDWQGALKTWESGLNRAKRKAGGRLAYNIAIANEVLGDLNTAKSWTQRSYVTYGNKKAMQYSRMLDQRIYQEERLKQQLGN